jgi:hypothetical protein
MPAEERTCSDDALRSTLEYLRASWFPRDHPLPAMRDLLLNREMNMNWIGLTAALAFATLVMAFITDFQMTSCKEGSFYNAIGFCKTSAPAPPQP